MSAYYNEHDPGAAAWLRELIRRGLIAPGEVDDRSIADVRPSDLAGFRQCHFFAGIGGWSLALRTAGWADDRPVWTGSPPCQPFSAAGKGDGYDDARHLAPVWLGLVRECRPERIFGEQVASAAILGRAATTARKAAGGGAAWLDDLFDGLEAAGYACGAGDLPAAGVGAPHIRQRCFFGAVRMADGGGERRQQDAGGPSANEGAHGRTRRVRGEPDGDHLASGHGADGRLADGDGGERDRGACGLAGHERDGAASGRVEGERHAAGGGGAGGLGDGLGAGLEGHAGHGDLRGQPGRNGTLAAGSTAPAGDAGGRPGAPHGGWADADWLLCRDAKWRPVEARPQQMDHGLPDGVGRGGDFRGHCGSDEEKARAIAQDEIGFPLGTGSYARVTRLRGYGNAIVPQVAAAFIGAFDAAAGEG